MAQPFKKKSTTGQLVPRSSNGNLHRHLQEVHGVHYTNPDVIGTGGAAGPRPPPAGPGRKKPVTGKFFSPGYHLVSLYYLCTYSQYDVYVRTGAFNGQRSITEFSPYPDAMSNEIHDALVVMRALDNRPFNVVECSGFRHFVEKATQKRYALPCRATLRNREQMYCHE